MSADVIPHTKPSFDQQEIDAMVQVLSSRMVNEGEQAADVVARLSRLTGSFGGVPVSTGTLGLHLALKTLGISGPEDKVIIPDYACRCLYDCVRMAGGTPVFADINLDDYSLDIDSARARVSGNTRAVILPHMYGCPADIDAFLTLGIPVVEDCAHSAGATYRGRPVGSSGDLAVFSFEGSKMLAAGEGGAVTAKGPQILERLQDLRYGLNGHFGHHYRLSDLVAAVALVQLDKLPAMLARRHHIAGVYRSELAGLEQAGHLRLPTVFADRQSGWYRFVVLCGSESAALIRHANEQGVLMRNPLPSGVLSDTYPHDRGSNENARTLAANGASLPITPDMTDHDVMNVLKAVHSFYGIRS